ncbi:hypothetical protein FAM19404_02003 [Lacticaseibacillus paracasei]|nr:hypothetical protein FAM19404_02003 [Lacticaseibacillus paracasei]
MSELATRRFGVATAKLEWWARLRAHRRSASSPDSILILKRYSDLLMQERLTIEVLHATPAMVYY